VGGRLAGRKSRVVDVTAAEARRIFLFYNKNKTGGGDEACTPTMGVVCLGFIWKHLELLRLLGLSAYRDVVRREDDRWWVVWLKLLLIFSFSHFLRSIGGLHTARTRTSKACIEGGNHRNPPWKLWIKLFIIKLLNY